MSKKLVTNKADYERRLKCHRATVQLRSHLTTFFSSSNIKVVRQGKRVNITWIDGVSRAKVEEAVKAHRHLFEGRTVACVSRKVSDWVTDAITASYKDQGFDARYASEGGKLLVMVAWMSEVLDHYDIPVDPCKITVVRTSRAPLFGSNIENSDLALEFERV